MYIEFIIRYYNIHLYLYINLKYCDYFCFIYEQRKLTQLLNAISNNVLDLFLIKKKYYTVLE